MDPVIHFEIPAADMGRAKSFYEKVFGWKIRDSYPTYYWAGTAEHDSDGFSMTTGVINGALQRKDDTIHMPRVVVKVENIDESINKALAEGASIFIRKTKAPGLYYCVLHDTEGNEVNILEEITK